LLINNEGGAEFHFVFGKEKIPTINMHTSAEHHVNAKNWVEANGFTYLSANNPEQLRENMRIFHAPSDKPIVFEVFTDKELDSKTVKAFYAHNGKLENTQPYAGIKKLLGDQGIAMVKKILK
jgi:2-succinyl-5-enolpyruvyl-6-hydroxy-3-cyclohexene-1-carboxylate synthase